MTVDEIAYARQSRARLWNLMLGGSEAYETERSLLRRLNGTIPGFALLARNERDLINRFWRYVTGVRNIRQVLYMGAPLPAGHSPHRRLANPGLVVYVEGDDLLYRKGAAWMAEDHITVVHADSLDVEAVIDTASQRIDWLEPVAVIAPSVLPWVDEGFARTWVKRLVEELPPGSMLATTHFLDPQLPDSIVPIEQLLIQLDGTVGAAFFRRRAALEALFPDLALETPGVTLAVDWFPNGPRSRELALVDQLLAVAVVAVARSSP